MNFSAERILPYCHISSISFVIVCEKEIKINSFAGIFNAGKE